jgi:hypothetical protein
MVCQVCTMDPATTTWWLVCPADASLGCHMLHACRRQLAAQLGHRTAAQQLVIVSSPFSRTRETAERVAAVLHLEPAVGAGGVPVCCSQLYSQTKQTKQQVQPRIRRPAGSPMPFLVLHYKEQAEGGLLAREQLSSLWSWQCWTCGFPAAAACMLRHKLLLGRSCPGSRQQGSMPGCNL